MPEQFSPDTHEKTTFSMLDKEKGNQEPLDVALIDEETFDPSSDVELFSGDIREPGMHEAEIMTEEATEQLYQARAEEDTKLANQHSAATADWENRTATQEVPIMDDSFFASGLVKDVLNLNEYSPAERERAEQLEQTVTAIEKILDILPKHSVLRKIFENALERKDESELLNLNKIRSILTKKYADAQESNEQFTPEMAMEFYERQFKKNLNSPTTGEEYDPTLPDRYLTVKSLFEEDPRTLLVLMGLSTEETTGNMAA